MNENVVPPALSRVDALAYGANLALGAAGLILTATAVWALVLCVRRVWPRARVVAAWSFWLSVAVQLLAWFVVPLTVANTAMTVGADGDVSPKATVLATSIARGMNWTAPLLLGTPIAVAGWVVARRRMRRAHRDRR